MGHKPERIITSAVEEHGVSTIVTEHPESSSASTYQPLCTPLVETVGATADCDVVVGAEAPEYDGTSSILIPLAGGPHSPCAIQIAQALATYYDAWIELLHVLPEEASDDRIAEGEQYLSEGIDQVEDQVNADRWLLESGDVATEIIEQSMYYDITVIGAPQKGRLRQFISGSTTTDVEREATNTVLTVRKNGDDSCVRRWVGRGT